jgi:hypothetical protein
VPNRSIVALAALLAAACLAVPAAAAAQQRDAGPDVLVVGGTPSGVAAAIAAARDGLHVTLVSANGDLGGVLSDGMMDQWDLNLTPSGAPIESGIFGEIYDRLGEAFTPQAAAQTLADMVASEPRITVRYDERPVAVERPIGFGADETVASVTFQEHSSGARSTIRAPFIVDATDNGDVAALAGAHYDLGRQDTGVDEGMQPVTVMFTLDGVDWAKVESSYEPLKFGPGGTTDRNAWGYHDFMTAYKPSAPNVLVPDLNFGKLADGEVSVNAIDVLGINGLDPSQLDLARHLTMHEAQRLATYLRANLPGFENARVGRFASEVYVRETRHFAGLERLTGDDVWTGKIPADSVGLASYPIDIHPVVATDKSAYAPLRHVYGIPFGVLVPKGLGNLLLASPAISATHLAAGSARTIPTTIEEGEAAGAACALALREKIDFVALAQQPERLAALRDDLVTDGMLLRPPHTARLAKSSALRRG